MLKSKRSIVIVLVFVAVVFTAVFAAAGLNADYTSTGDAAIQNTALDKQIETLKEAKAEFQLDKKGTDKKPEIITYVVKSGDTLGGIANTYGTSAGAIAESNGIDENSVITEGQQIRFPSVKGVLHKIKDGETLWDISTANGVDPQDIASVNGMASPDNLKIGQEIIIPGIDKIKQNEVVSAKASSSPAAKTSSSAGTKSAAQKLASRGSSGSTSVSSSTAGFVWPLRGIITSYFGPRWGEFHEGIDIAAPIGTDIKVVADGSVIYSGWMNGFGNYIKINHGNGIETYYGHNSKNLVTVGEHVSKGQVIAKLGSTGRSTGPHTEFGVTKNGSPVNPLLYLK